MSLHTSLPNIISLQNDTKALKIIFPAAKYARLKMTKPKMPEISQKPNELATAYFTTCYPATIYTFTKRHSSIKNYVPSFSKWQSQACQKKAKKQNQTATVYFTI